MSVHASVVPPPNSKWDLCNSFVPPAIPSHLQKLRRLKHSQSPSQEDNRDEDDDEEEDEEEKEQQQQRQEWRQKQQQQQQRRKEEEDLRMVLQEEGIPDLEDENLIENTNGWEEQTRSPPLPEQDLLSIGTNGNITTNGFIVEKSSNDSELGIPSKEASEAEEQYEDSEEDGLIPSMEDSLEVSAEELGELEEKEGTQEEGNLGELKEDSKPMEELAFARTRKSRNLKEVVMIICEQFIRACAGMKDASGALETHKLHRHSNVSDQREPIKIFNIITFYWPSKIPVVLNESEEEADTVQCGMAGSHVSTLERLYAWEKKLCNEVKAGEKIKGDFERKCKELSSQTAKGVRQLKVDKIRVAVKDLDSRLKVALCVVQSISIKIQRLSDKELYPQLAEIVGGLMMMWRVMLECYRTQKQVAMEMSSLEESSAGTVEASAAHRRATVELETQLKNWHRVHTQWVKAQLDYLNALREWILSCQCASSERERDSKGERKSVHPLPDIPIYKLVSKWQGALAQLEAMEKYTYSIWEFAQAVHALEAVQLRELRQKQKVEGFSRDLERKTLSLENREKRYQDRPDDGRTSTLDQKRSALDKLCSRLEEEEEKHSLLVQERLQITFESFKQNLCAVFDSMSTFSATVLTEYELLQLELENNNSSRSENGGLPERQDQ